MSSSDIFYKIGGLLQDSFVFFESVGNIFNFSVIILGFFGFFYWMNIQKKFNDKASKDPNQLK
jgi:hypothetical protein